MRLNPKPLLFSLILAIGLATAAFLVTSYFRYTSAGAVRAYLDKNPNETAIACFDPASPAAGFYRNETEPFPLAATFKLVLLAAYAEETANRRLDPQELIPVSELERFYLPGTDGGAHDEFLKAQGSATRLELDTVVTGMLSYSSNAAADYLLSRLGAVDFPALYQHLGLEQTDPPFSYLGLYLFIKNHETGLYAEEELTPAELRAEQARLAHLFATDPAWRAAEVSFISKPTNAAPLNIQKEAIARAGMRGSARDLSRLLLAAYGADSPLSAEARQRMRTQLEWPSRLHPENRETFQTLAATSGAWPGVLTSAWYAESLSGQPRILVVLYRNLPDDFWNTWVTTFSHQQLENQVLATGDCSLLSAASR